MTEPRKRRGWLGRRSTQVARWAETDAARHTSWAVIAGLLLLVALMLAFVLSIWLNDADQAAGSAAEWFTAFATIFIGVLTAVFAYNAWRASQQAARAERRSVFAMERELAGRVRLELDAWWNPESESAYLTLSVPEGAPAIATVHLSVVEKWSMDDSDKFANALTDALHRLAGKKLMSGQEASSSWDYEFNAKQPFDRDLLRILVNVVFTFPDPEFASDKDRDPTFHTFSNLQVGFEDHYDW